MTSLSKMQLLNQWHQFPAKKMKGSDVTLCNAISSSRAVLGSGKFLAQPRKGGEDYISHMFNIYETVIEVGLSNFMSVHITVPH